MPRPQVQGLGLESLLAQLHWNCEKRTEAYASPPGSVCLPYFVEQLYHFIVDDEHNGDIQADPAQAGNSTLVESRGAGWRGHKR